MTWPAPQPGLLFQYAYLWRREALIGREEGQKDRPCLAVAVSPVDSGTRVYALPITHTPPASDDEGVEIPQATKRRLKLDEQQSWIMLTEANVFMWPGPDVRRVPGEDGPIYGLLPPTLFRIVRDGFLTRARIRAAPLTPR